MVDWFITYNRQVLAAIFIASILWTILAIWKNR